MSGFRFDRRGQIKTLVVSTAIVGLGATMLGAAPAQSALRTAEDPQCAAAIPTDELTRDMPVTGMTVSTGTEPEAFSGEVIGTLDDGIAPGLDMVIVRLTSPEIDRVGGIWAGMSGSPVYAPDGRLIGAVSYGLAWGASPVAGVTPAADMQALFEDAGPPTSSATSAALAEANGPEKVAIPNRMGNRMLADGAASEAEVDGGLTRLTLPVGVSGMFSNQRIRQLNRALDLDDVRLFRASGSDAADPADEIVAGGNIAASLSYGDLTTAGVGTATQVCDDEVIAFGHPMFWSGPTSLTMHSADALYVQEDPVAYPFKVANITGAAGTIDDDRMAGIQGVLGSLPDTAEIKAAVTSGSKSYTGWTYVSVPWAVPDIAAFHLLADEDRVFDGIGEGSATVSWTVKGLRSDGTPFSYTRKDMFASDYDITYETIFDSYEQLYKVLNNKFDEVSITQVSYTADLDREVRTYRVKGVKLAKGDRWVGLDKGQRVKVHPGQRLEFRVLLASTSGAGAKSVTLVYRVPRGTAGKSGSLQFQGGSNLWGTGGGGSTFGQFLDNLADAPHNNDVLGAMRIRKAGSDIKVSKAKAFTAVVGGYFGIDLRIVK